MAEPCGVCSGTLPRIQPPASTLAAALLIEVPAGDGARMIPLVHQVIHGSNWIGLMRKLAVTQTLRAEMI